MFTRKDMLEVAKKIHRQGRISWARSLYIACRLRSFYNLAEVLDIEYEKTGIYFQ